MNYDAVKNKEVRRLLEKYQPDPSVIDLEYHMSVLEELDRFLHLCGVSPSYFFKSAFDLCKKEDADIAYIHDHRDLMKKGKVGLVYLGEWRPTVTERMQVMGALLMRNKILPRVVTGNRLLKELSTNLAYNPKYLLASSFISNRTPTLMATYGILPEDIYDWLYERMLQGRITMLGITDPKIMKAVFEDIYPDMIGLLNNHFKMVAQGG